VLKSKRYEVIEAVTAEEAIIHLDNELTAYTMKRDREEFLTAGCDGYISKPIDTQELPKIVARFLGN
jgi:CheY-like chemotaxis protein